jgi:uncharacterized membrane protein
MTMAETIDVGPDGTALPSRDVSGEKTTLHIVYLLHALAPFTVWTLAAVAVLIGFIKRDNVRGTFLESHYSWLSGAFWWALAWLAMAWIAFWVITLLTLGVGAIVMWVVPAIAYGVLFVWYLYRVVRGWLALNDNKALG